MSTWFLRGEWNRSIKSLQRADVKVVTRGAVWSPVTHKKTDFYWKARFCPSLPHCSNVRWRELHRNMHGGQGVRYWLIYLTTMWQRHGEVWPLQGTSQDRLFFLYRRDTYVEVHVCAAETHLLQWLNAQEMLLSLAAPPSSLKHWSVAVFSGGEGTPVVFCCLFPVRQLIKPRKRHPVPQQHGGTSCF